MDIEASPAPFEFVWGDLQSLSITPKRLTKSNGWHTHSPFAFWLMKQLEPSIFVQLGVCNGDSYSTFCQAVQTFSQSTACYGIDTWQREDPASSCDESVYAELLRYHNDHYAAFSRLILSSFDDALPHFVDGSIDLLFINGHSSYEDVKHDFESWLPRLSNRATVLFQGINSEGGKSGIWKFFLELSKQYAGRCFPLTQGNGLGVLTLGDDAPDVLQHLGCLEGEVASSVRLTFSTFGKFVEAQATELMLRSEIEQLRLAVREAICAAEKSEKLKDEYTDELVKAYETEKRKIEIDNHKAELYLSSRCQEVSQELEKVRKQYAEVCRENETLKNSRSMKLTKPLRDLLDFTSRFRR